MREALGHAQMVCQRTGNPVMHDHLHWYDLYHAAKLLLLPQSLDVVRFHPVFVEVVQQQGRNLVVQCALALEAGPFDVVVGHHDILVVENHLVRNVG